ncbi:isoleucine--tRNA ligase [Candidatus Woesearchaeota archaeon]|nr:isoleucine--tRNA ligase [Candidatus Woesearchaeota archaeon]
MPSSFFGRYFSVQTSMPVMSRQRLLYIYIGERNCFKCELDLLIMKYDPLKIEPEILKLWSKKKIFKKVKKKASKGKYVYFLDGPPYTSGKVHVGTAWNRALKDCYRRYLWMRGLNVNDTPGFDMHGLPIEVKVEKKLGISKKGVEEFGVKKFIKTCKKFATGNMSVMIKDFQRLGEWMDWENPYTTIKNEYMEGAWWALKKAHEKNLLYKGKKVMTWCPRCATTLAKHELEYETLADESIFIKFKVANKKNEYLLVWTTTPWTIPFNLAVMVHPDYDYLKIKVGDEVWVVAKALANALMGVIGKKYKIKEEIKGKDLKGVEYEHPLINNIPVLKKIKDEHKWAHKVILSEEFVDTTAGTGLVHTAPGCGPEDQQVGEKYDLPAFNEIDEHGVFSKKMGKYAGWVARKDDLKFIKELKDKGLIIRTSEVDHEYAHCWRCKSPVVFRATEQWFIGVGKLKDKLLKINKKIEWVPDWAGNKWFASWLKNLQDWCISRQRYWGIPIPIWICECGKTYVIGDSKELKKLAGKIPKDLHKPWIDKVKIKCECGKKAERIPDVFDVWLDSAAATWASLPKKQRDKAIADFILEGKDQIRGWFNSLLTLSWAARKKPAYKSVYMHGFILDSQGRKMSKSIGNVIKPEEVIDKWGSDTFRYYTIGGSDPGLDLNYNFKDVKVKNKFLNILWNIHIYLINYTKFFGKNLTKIKANVKNVEDKYIVSKTNSIIRKATEHFDKKEISTVPNLIEDLYLELSRWYIKTMREDINITKLKILFDCYLNVLKLSAPIIPFISEQIWQNFKKEFKLKEESIHLCDWPKANKRKINKALEEQIGFIKNITTSILAVREKLNRPVRWPIKSATIVTTDDKISKAVKKHEDLIKALTNVWNIKIEKKLGKINYDIKADYAKLGPKYGEKTPEIIMRVAEQSPESIMKKLKKEKKFVVSIGKKKFDITKDDLIIQEKLPDGVIGVTEKDFGVYLEKDETSDMLASGFAREITRKIQALRKKAGLEKPDKISLVISVDEGLEKQLQEFTKDIKSKVGAKKLEFVKVSGLKHSKKFKIRNKEISIGFKVI